MTWTMRTDINAQYQDFGDSADALQDGKIDAAFVVAGAPTVAITTLATAKDTYLVGLDDEHIAKLQETSPYYEKYVIPEGTYEGVPETTTVAVVAVVIARDDVSEDDVYNICLHHLREHGHIWPHDKGRGAGSGVCRRRHRRALSSPARPSTSPKRALTCPPSKIQAEPDRRNYGGDLRRSSLTYPGRSPSLEEILRNERGPHGHCSRNKGDGA